MYTNSYFIKELSYFFIFILTLLISPVITFASNANYGVEEKVKAFFADTPVLINIAHCETRFRQYNSNGSTLHGGYKNHMIGLMQFSGYYHKRTALSLGYDIYTLKGNMGYAKYLYHLRGTRPWQASAHCWKKKEIPKLQAVKQTHLHSLPKLPKKITHNLDYGMVDNDVLFLQKFLNEQGIVVASYGPGSPGHETNYYGTKTRVAVMRYQCAHKIICDGNEGTTGYGAVYKDTLAKLNFEFNKIEQRNISNATSTTNTNNHTKKVVKKDIEDISTSTKVNLTKNNEKNIAIATSSMIKKDASDKITIATTSQDLVTKDDSDGASIMVKVTESKVNKTVSVTTTQNIALKKDVQIGTISTSEFQVQLQELLRQINLLQEKIERMHAS